MGAGLKHMYTSEERLMELKHNIEKLLDELDPKCSHVALCFSPDALVELPVLYVYEAHHDVFGTTLGRRMLDVRVFDDKVLDVSSKADEFDKLAAQAAARLKAEVVFS